MQFGPSDFFRIFFRELEEQKIPYVVLHSYDELPEKIESDVDFCVPTGDLPKLPGLLQKLATGCGWRLAHSVEAHIYAYYAVIVDPQQPGVFIQVDGCSHYVEGPSFFLRDEELLEGRVRHRDFYVPAPATEFAYLLAKALAKGLPLAPKFPRLKELRERDPVGSQEWFQRWFSGQTEPLEKWLAKSPEAWEPLREKFLAQNRFGIGDRLREGLRAVKRVSRPTGLHLALLGSDGAGKSTLLERLAPMIDGPFFRRRWVFHFRPKSFERGTSGPPVTDPHGSPPRNPLAATAKLFYYAGDHFFGYFKRVFPAKVRNELIIFDRTFDDVLVDPRRYRLRKAGWLAKLLRRFIPRPDLMLILDAEPAQVRARKPELPLDELQRQRAVLQHLARERGCVMISASPPPAEVADAAYREVIRFLADRELKRAGN